MELNVFFLEAFNTKLTSSITNEAVDVPSDEQYEL